MTWEEAVIWLRSQPDRQELVRACYFDDPLLDAAKRFADSEEWAAVKEYMPHKPGKVLDIGAGMGISSYALARDGWQVTALEPDPSSLVGSGAIKGLSEQSGLHIQVLESTAETVSLDEALFDVAYGRQVLHHASNLDELCRRVYRVLRPGGRFIATREHVINRHSDLDRFLNSHPLHKLYGGENAYLLKEYISAIGKSGLRIVKVLGPFDSAINLFPSKRRDIGANLLGKILGKKMAGTLTNEDHILGRALLTVMCASLSKVYNSPGRLYSFIAEKPLDRK